MHYTRKHGSWLNEAQIEINLFSGPCPATAGSEIELLCGDKLRLGTAR
jgi:hypothetical protein